MPDKSSTRTYWLSGTISVLALALAAVHLLVPDVEIDAITLTLVGLAIVPWLAPLVKSVELPGGWKFELRELKEKVEQELRRSTEQVSDIADRVEELSQFVITGPAPAAWRSQLARELSKYRDYLVDLGADLAAEPPPTVEIRTGFSNAYYDPQKSEIVTGPHFAEADVLFREYSHHVLEKVRGRGALSGARQDAVESGLADYFSCSYRDDPELGREVAGYLGHDRPVIRDLGNRKRLTDVEAPHVVQLTGEVWGGAFWELRQLLGQQSADRLLLKAWAEAPADADAAARFVQLVAELAGAEKDAVHRIFEQRGLPG